MNFDTATSLRLIAESLSVVDHFGAQPIECREVRVSDQTLVVEIVARSSDPIRVRSEIANVMGALSGLDVPRLFPVLQARALGVHAFDPDDQELVWIISSFSAAEFIARGQPIEWLSRSLVQENTAEYRRSQADRIIGQVETALRDLIDHHGIPHGGNAYIEHLWPASDIKKMREQLRREGGEADDARGVLDFALIYQLREAIVGSIEWFDDGCIPDLVALERSLTEMNRVRRKVAHHRAISNEEVRTSRRIADDVLVPLGKVHPDLVSDFLVDRWEEGIEEIFSIVQHAVASPLIPERGATPDEERRRAAVTALEVQSAAIESAVTSLSWLIVPAPRKALHSTALAALIQQRDALADLLSQARRPDLTLREAETAHALYAEALGEVAELRARIRAIRVGQAPSGA